MIIYPTHEQIAKLAHETYEENIRLGINTAMTNWINAEQELLEQLNNPHGDQ